MHRSACAQITIPAELFALAESSHFCGVLDLDHLDVGSDLYSFVSPVSWEADLTNTGGALLVQGRVQAQACTACARCLEETCVSFDADFDTYVVLGDAEDPADREGDEFERLPENHVFDLEPHIIAALLMDAPRIPLCAPDCKGLCSQCGANLNEGTCACSQLAEGKSCGDADAREVQADNPFACLKDLDFSD